MNNTTKIPPPAFIRVDEMIQRVLGILVLVTLIFYPIAMLLLIPFGAWQVISGIIGTLYGSKWRMKYLGWVTLYFSTLGILTYMGDYYFPSDSYWIPLLTVIYCGSPLAMGIVYYIKTRKERPEKDGVKPKWEDMDDVLDIEMVETGK